MWCVELQYQKTCSSSRLTVFYVGGVLECVVSGVDPHGGASHRLSQSEGHRGARSSRIFPLSYKKQITKLNKEISNLNYSTNYIRHKKMFCAIVSHHHFCFFKLTFLSPYVMLAESALW